MSMCVSLGVEKIERGKEAFGREKEEEEKIDL